MIVIAYVREVTEVKTVVFADGTQHRVQQVWVAPAEPDNEGKTWVTLTKLWDDEIERFAERKVQGDDPVRLRLVPSYRRTSTGDHVNSLYTKILDN
ncbi:MAG: hypothetical protein IKI44_05000 [Bacteroidaceae bacterium]|nr:hypothetical protein [Bacteroidaceae bacterium]MBR7052331.1 hypothetical protein [Bacteroidaceae bacterium]